MLQLALGPRTFQRLGRFPAKLSGDFQHGISPLSPPAGDSGQQILRCLQLERQCGRLARSGDAWHGPAYAVYFSGASGDIHCVGCSSDGIWASSSWFGWACFGSPLCSPWRIQPPSQRNLCWYGRDGFGVSTPAWHCACLAGQLGTLLWASPA